MSIGGDKRREEAREKTPRRGGQGEEEQEKPEAGALPELEKRRCQPSHGVGSGGQESPGVLGGRRGCCPE